MANTEHEIKDKIRNFLLGFPRKLDLGTFLILESSGRDVSIKTMGDFVQDITINEPIIGKVMGNIYRVLNEIGYDYKRFVEKAEGKYELILPPQKIKSKIDYSVFSQDRHQIPIDLYVQGKQNSLPL